MFTFPSPTLTRKTPAPSVAGKVKFGLLGHWKFDAESAIDSSPEGNNGALIGSPTFTNGIVGAKAIVFNGTTQIVKVPKSPSLSPGSDNFTVATWGKTTASAPAEDMMMVTQRESGTATPPFASNDNALFQLKLDAITGYAACVFRADDGTAGTVTGNVDMTDGRWHHYAMVFDWSGNLELFVDAISIGTTSLTGSDALTFEIAEWIIGGVSLPFFGPPDLTEFFDGSMDDVRAYGRALTVDELVYLSRATN